MFVAVGHGGARSSQGAGACAALNPWRPHQALLAAVGAAPAGANKCARTWFRSRVRSPALPKSRWVARRPQLLKQPPFPHHDTQNSGASVIVRWGISSEELSHRQVWELGVGCWVGNKRLCCRGASSAAACAATAGQRGGSEARYHAAGAG